MSELIVLRHGETEWSRTGRHTGTSDIPLTARGEEQARHLLDDLGERDFVEVLVSPLQRATVTAQLAGIEEYEIDPDLAEWDYGEVDGLTTADYVARREADGRGPWNLWTDGADGGESVAAVGVRADRVLERVHPLLERGDVLVVAHGHLLRVLVARWLGLEVRHGEGFLLDAAHRSVLTRKRGAPAVKYWNVPPTH